MRIALPEIRYSLACDFVICLKHLSKSLYQFPLRACLEHSLNIGLRLQRYQKNSRLQNVKERMYVKLFARALFKVDSLCKIINYG